MLLLPSSGPTVLHLQMSDCLLFISCFFVSAVTLPSLTSPAFPLWGPLQLLAPLGLFRIISPPKMLNLITTAMSLWPWKRTYWQVSGIRTRASFGNHYLAYHSSLNSNNRSKLKQWMFIKIQAFHNCLVGVKIYLNSIRQRTSK